MANDSNVSNQDKLVKIITKQLSKEFSEIVSVLSQHMEENNLLGLRISYIHDFLFKVLYNIPGHAVFEEKLSENGQNLDKVVKSVYLMFREALVNKLLDVDTVGSTGDPNRDEHLLFRLSSPPTLLSLEELIYSKYTFKTSDYFYKEQGSLLYEIMDEISGKAKERSVEVVSAIRGRSASIAMSIPADDAKG